MLLEPQNRNHPIYFACVSDNLSIVKLVYNSCPVAITIHARHITPLNLARDYGYPKAVAFLEAQLELQHQARENVEPDEKGQLPELLKRHWVPSSLWLLQILQHTCRQPVSFLSIMLVRLVVLISSSTLLKPTKSCSNSIPRVDLASSHCMSRRKLQRGELHLSKIISWRIITHRWQTSF